MRPYYIDKAGSKFCVVDCDTERCIKFFSTRQEAEDFINDVLMKDY